MALDAWSKVICAYNKPEELRDLLFPLVQIIIGTITINSNPKFTPLRLKVFKKLNQLCSILNKISMSTNIFIPTGQYLLNILDTKKINVSKSSIKEAVNIEFRIKVKKGFIKTQEFQIRVLEETIFLILEYLAIYHKTISFPEISYPAVFQLKQYLKEFNSKQGIKAKISKLIKLVKENNDFIFEKRSTVDFTPLDFEKTKNFLSDIDTTPLYEYYLSENSKRSKNIIDRIDSLIKESALSSLQKDEKNLNKEFEINNDNMKNVDDIDEDEKNIIENDEKNEKNKEKNEKNKGKKNNGKKDLKRKQENDDNEKNKKIRKLVSNKNIPEDKVEELNLDDF
jgi:nucleolar complex protein 2